MTEKTPEPGQGADQTATPAGLGAAGTALWTAITDRLDLDAHESALLLQAARTADRLDRLDAVVARDGIVVESGAVHPALVEARQQSIILARLIAALRLPEDDEGEALARPQRRGALRGAYGPRAVA